MRIDAASGATAAVEAEPTCSESNDLKKAADDRYVLEKVDELILVAQRRVKKQGRCDAKEGQSGGSQPNFD